VSRRSNARMRKVSVGQLAMFDVSYVWGVLNVLLGAGSRPILLPETAMGSPRHATANKHRPDGHRLTHPGGVACVLTVQIRPDHFNCEMCALIGKHG